MGSFRRLTSPSTTSAGSSAEIELAVVEPMASGAGGSHFLFNVTLDRVHSLSEALSSGADADADAADAADVDFFDLSRDLKRQRNDWFSLPPDGRNCTSDESCSVKLRLRCASFTYTINSSVFFIVSFFFELFYYY